VLSSLTTEGLIAALRDALLEALERGERRQLIRTVLVVLGEVDDSCSSS
jgi:hypothetical protein